MPAASPPLPTTQRASTSHQYRRAPRAVMRKIWGEGATSGTPEIGRPASPGSERDEGRRAGTRERGKSWESILGVLPRGFGGDEAAGSTDHVGHPAPSTQGGDA